MRLYGGLRIGIGAPLSSIVIHDREAIAIRIYNSLRATLTSNYQAE
jgi:hypothetical protein